MSISDAELARASQANVYIGHQSVGGNLIDAVPGLYQSRGLEPPLIVDAARPVEPLGSTIAHSSIGTNGDPASKLQEFESIMRSGAAAAVDAALMKFCYVDIDRDTDVEALFAKYQATMEALKKEFPGVAFIYTTVPLTTERGWKQGIKALLGRDDRMGPADNAARERYNVLVRIRYGSTGRLVDLAQMESTTPGGQRVAGTYGSQPYYALYRGYAADPGHLNEFGARTVTSGLLATIAGSTGDTGD